MTELTRQEIGMSKRITDYQMLRERVPQAIAERVPDPKRWLDIGCGCGGSVRRSLESFPNCRFTLVDPMPENIEEVKHTTDGKCDYIVASSHDLDIPDGTFDVITAILSHHYYSDLSLKEKAVSNCRRMLKNGGVFLYVEHTIYDDQSAKDAEWRSYMENKGLEETSIQEMFDRRNKVYFPLGKKDHIDMLKRVGFKDIEVFWRSCSDIGFIASR